jgi:hypothetical protein
MEMDDLKGSVGDSKRYEQDLDHCMDQLDKISQSADRHINVGQHLDDFKRESALEMETFRRSISDMLEHRMEKVTIEVDKDLEEFRRECAQDLQQLEGTCEELRGLVEQANQLAVDLSGQATGELQDHTAAITNMMDMLERTSTHDDLARERADLDLIIVDMNTQLNALSNRANDSDTEAERMRKHIADALGAHGRIGDLEGLVQNAVRELAAADDLRNVEQLVRDTARDLALKSKDLEQALSRRLLETERRANQTSLSVETFGETVRKQGSVSEQVVHSVQALETKLDNTAQLLHQETEQLVRQWADMTEGRVDAVESKLANSAKMLTDSAKSASTSFENDLKLAQQSMHDSLFAFKKQMDTALLKADGILDDGKVLQQKVDKSIGDVQTKVDLQLATTVARIDTVHTDFADHSADSAKKLGEMERLVAAATSQVREEVIMRASIVDTHRKQLTDMIEDAKHELAAKHATEITRVKGELGLEKADVHSSMSRLQAAMEANTRAVTGKFDTQSKTLTDEVRNLERSFTDKTTLLDAATTDNQKQLSKALSALETRFIERNSVTDARLAEISSTANGNNATVTSLCSRIETKLTKQVSACEARQDSTYQQVAGIWSSVDQKLSEQKERLMERSNERLEHLTRKIQDFNTLYSERCGALDRRFTQWGAEFTDQYRQTQSTLEARVDGASDRVEENDAKLARVESAVKTMDGVVTSNQALATKVKDDLETRLREMNEKHDSTVCRRLYPSSLRSS